MEKAHCAIIGQPGILQGKNLETKYNVPELMIFVKKNVLSHYHSAPDANKYIKQDFFLKLKMGLLKEKYFKKYTTKLYGILI